MSEEVVDVTQIPLPRKVPGVIHEAAYQALTGRDRIDLEVARQLLPGWLNAPTEGVDDLPLQQYRGSNEVAPH